MSLSPKVAMPSARFIVLLSERLDYKGVGSGGAHRLNCSCCKACEKLFDLLNVLA
jgi:hypothetical protein